MNTRLDILGNIRWVDERHPPQDIQELFEMIEVIHGFNFLQQPKRLTPASELHSCGYTLHERFRRVSSIYQATLHSKGVEAIQNGYPHFRKLLKTQGS